MTIRSQIEDRKASRLKDGHNQPRDRKSDGHQVQGSCCFTCCALPSPSGLREGKHHKIHTATADCIPVPCSPSLQGFLLQLGQHQARSKVLAAIKQNCCASVHQQSGASPEQNMVFPKMVFPIFFSPAKLDFPISPPCS